ECGHSDADKKSCVDGWERDAAKFIDDEHRKYVRAAADYYLSTRLRSSPEQRQRYCKPLKASLSSAAYRAALSAWLAADARSIFRSSSVSARTTRAGAPTMRLPRLNCLPSVTSAPAPMMHSVSITAAFRI